MWSSDIALFYVLNATAATPAWVLALARFASGVLPGVIVGLLLLGLVVGPRSLRRSVLQALGSLAVAWCIVHVGRALVPFPRPAELGLGIQWIPHGVKPGFPSMHSATAFALAFSLLLCRSDALAGVATLAAVLIAWSRVCLGVHFPSDVLAGMVTGLLSATLVAIAWRTVERTKSTTPAPLKPVP